MTFAEKLTFLMHLSETTNKELAAVLSVDPSMISLMRTGKRNLSRKPEQAKKIAAYFARQCSAPFQRQALSDMLDQISISPSLPEEALAAILERWIQGKNDTLTDRFLSGFKDVPDFDKMLPFSHPRPSSVGADDGQTQFFFGPEGRQEVIFRVMQACRNMENPGSILTVVDDNLEWLLPDYAMTRKIQASLFELIEQGFDFCQIIPPLNYINRYAESLQFWLPLYATGKGRAFYYPRLRGNVYRHSIIVIPGCCVQYASTIGPGSTSEVTMFSTNPELVQAFEKQFQDYLRLCRPAMNVYRDYKETLPLLRRFNTCQGSTIQLVNKLSLITMPQEFLEQRIKESPSLIEKEFLKLFLEDIPVFEDRLSRDLYVDMGRLATPEEIRSGSIPIPSACALDSGAPCYTPETYCLHLKNILRLMDQYENYCFLPMSKKEYPDYDIYANEEGLAMIIRTEPPFITTEFRRQAIAFAFREHLFRLAELDGFDPVHRDKVRMELRSLINRLSS